MITNIEVPRFLNSLSGRFIVASVLCLPLFIGASGLLLERAFKDSLIAAEMEQLRSQLYILLGSAELLDDSIWLPEQLPEPRYSVVDSGLYAQVLRPLDQPGNSGQQWQVQWQSSSAELASESLPNSLNRFASNQELFENSGDFFRFTFDAVWETDSAIALPLRFEIHHERSSYVQQLRRYRTQLWYGLSLLAMGLLSVQVLIMRWGLRPLKALVRDLRRLPEQQERKLLGTYPAEIEPVTDSLNEVLANEQNQRQRYQNTLSDLAHSLKTPLAIAQGELQTETATNSEQQIIGEQLDRMNDIIRHQLQRAVLQTNRKLQSREPLLPIVERLRQAMSKVYRDKGVQFTVDIENDLCCAVDSQDLFEVLGNLIENACKYGQGKVSVTANNTSGLTTIRIGDNGPGIESSKRNTILERGARLDTAQPGQGIGLAVCADIISAYDGSIRASQSESLGGAEFVVQIPG